MNLLCLLALLLLALLAARARAFGFDEIRTDFTLVAGRPSACPRQLSVSSGSSDAIPPEGITVDGAPCAGPGATLLSPGDRILRAGLPLPDLLVNEETRFIAAVDTAARRCGAWAFNASSVTWFVANLATSPVTDPALGATLTARRAHVILTGLADVCVMQATDELPVDQREDEDVSNGTSGGDADADYSAEIAEHESMAKPPKACFPGDATVRVRGGAAKRMRDVRVGDAVLAGDGRYSEVIALSHASPGRLFTFVRLTTGGGVVDVSEGHVMIERRGTVVAGELRVGDTLAGAKSGEWHAILRVEHVRRRGLYNPHTMTGDIVVDGVLATTWTSAVPPVAATTALAPLRSLFRVAPRQVATAAGALLLSAINAVESKGLNPTRPFYCTKFLDKTRLEQEKGTPAETKPWSSS